MDPTLAINLGLGILGQALKLIGELKSQHGLTDDEINSHAQAVCGDNDVLYQQMKAALTSVN